MATGDISLPEPLLSEIRSAAQSEHRSTEEVLADAAKFYLEERSWIDLITYGQQRAALGIEGSDIDRLISESRAEERNR